MAAAFSLMLVKNHRPTQVHAGTQGAYLPKQPHVPSVTPLQKINQNTNFSNLNILNK